MDRNIFLRSLHVLIVQRVGEADRYKWPLQETRKTHKGAGRQKPLRVANNSHFAAEEISVDAANAAVLSVKDSIVKFKV